MDADLRQLGIETANDLRQQPQAKLIRHFGERIGMFLHLAARGKVASVTATSCWPCVRLTL
jgi:nucleotidyltransferase/DNA polymerase involved in DNA repair